VRWVAEHTQRDALALVEGGITRWEKMHEESGDEGEEYVRIARAILSRYSEGSGA
jgi:conserved oligomeric Golgi complex subunit 5